MIVDAHAHVDEVPALGWIDPPEALIAELDAAGIDRAVVMTYTEAPALNPRAVEYLAEQVARYPDRLIGYVRLHPWYEREAHDLLDRAIRVYRMKGLKLHPVGSLAHPASEPTLRLIRQAAAYAAPVLFHCGDEALTTPLQIARAAEQVPGAAIILGHMGGYFHVDEAIETAARLPNLYLETSAMPYPHLIRRAIDAIGPQRVLFASDGPGCSPRLEVRKVELAGLTSAERELVFHGNIQRLLDGVRHTG
ncbi:MAG: amidohydrolase family protein [Chloroflexota bacterium]|nr:amidohydrolase family protein [Chloroflexota bacterium]